MVSTYVRQSGGAIRIRSDVGAGTTIDMLLPRAVALSQAAARGPLNLPLVAEKSVLVVEDDPVVRLLISNVLKDMGYSAVDAPEALSALPILESDHGIDLLITDLGLPGVDGRKLAQRAQARRPGLKVLFMSGYLEKLGGTDQAFADGTDIIAKPFSFEELATRIESVMQTSRTS
jgi:CheY-like chemotaxis protein